MSKTKLSIITVFVIAIIAGLTIGITSGRSEPASAADEPFDHSNCQYPNRETNPPDGCDNSDPACPETIKYGYDCQPIGTTEKQQEIEAHDAPFKEQPATTTPAPKGCYQ